MDEDGYLGEKDIAMTLDLIVGTSLNEPEKEAIIKQV